MLEQRDQPVAEHVDRRLVAGVEQQDRRGEHLVVGEPVVALLGPQQVAQQVVAEVAAALERSARACSPANSWLAASAAACDLGGDRRLVHPHDGLRPGAQPGEVASAGRRAARRSPAPAAARRSRRARRTRAIRPRRRPAASRRARATRGRIRSTCPRANAAETFRRSRAWFGGSFSIIWLRCSRLNGSNTLGRLAGRARSGRAGGRAAPGCMPRGRPPARSALGSCQPTGPRPARRANAGYGSATNAGSSRSSRLSRARHPGSSFTGRGRRDRTRRAAPRSSAGRRARSRAGSPAPPFSQSSCRQRPHGISTLPWRSTQTTATSRPPPVACSAETMPHSAQSPTPYDAFSTLQPTTTRPSSTRPGSPDLEVRVRRVGAAHRLGRQPGAARPSRPGRQSSATQIDWPRR